MASAEQYGLLASAIAGRHVQISLREEPVAWSDGQAIFLPAARVAAQEGCWREVVVQAALLATDSLHARFMRPLVGRSKAAERYLYLEVVRASQLLRDRL